ncbi:MAG: histidine phosphatase family protein [Clostridia bacterium]|nr:histidine phosphatase family protein [Clostridia bacterium]
MRILIVRHAEPDYAHDCLTERGRRQADLLGERLRQIPAKAYYVSPLGRAQETAARTLAPLGRQAETLPWLAEFRGRALDENTGRMRIPWDFRTTQWYDRPLLADRDRWTEDTLAAGGDVREIWNETARGMDGLLLRHGYLREGGIYRCADNREDTLVLFCHYGIGMAVLSYLTGLAPLPMWQAFLFLPASITTLVTQERVKGEIEFRCLCAGDVGHLLNAPDALSWAGEFPECYNGVESTDPGLWPRMPEQPLVR